MSEWIWPNMRQLLKAVVLLGTSAVVSACSNAYYVDPAGYSNIIRR